MVVEVEQRLLSHVSMCHKTCEQFFLKVKSNDGSAECEVIPARVVIA